MCRSGRVHGHHVLALLCWLQGIFTVKILDHVDREGRHEGLRLARWRPDARRLRLRLLLRLGAHDYLGCIERNVLFAIRASLMLVFRWGGFGPR